MVIPDNPGELVDFRRRGMEMVMGVAAGMVVCLPGLCLSKKELCPTKFRPVEFLLHALKRRVTDGAVGAERYKASSLGVECCLNGLRIVLAAIPVSSRCGMIFMVYVNTVMLQILLGAAQLQLIAILDEGG